MAYEEELLHMGARVYRVMYSQKEKLIGASRILKRFLKSHPEIEGVYLHTNYPYVFPIKVAKQIDLKYRVMHAHSSAKLYENLKGINRVKQTIIDSFIYRNIKKCPTKRIACSDLVAKAVFKDNEYSLVTNGIDISQYSFDSVKRDSIRQNYLLTDNDTLLGFIGMLGYVKNPLKAVDIFYEYHKMNPRSKLAIIGSGSLLEEVKNKIQEYNIEQKVILTGMVANVNEWYNAIDVLIVPSLFEGFPMTLVEGQTNGLKAIISDTITKQVAVTDLVKFKSLDKDSKEWADSITEYNVNDNREQYANIMRKNGFEIEAMVNRICEESFL